MTSYMVKWHSGKMWEYCKPLFHDSKEGAEKQAEEIRQAARERGESEPPILIENLGSDG